jgi:endo-1,4-beta-xylanase
MEREYEMIDYSHTVNRRAFLKHAISTAALMGAGETLSGCTPPREFDARQTAANITEVKLTIRPETNLIAEQSWHLRGARQTPDGLIIYPVHSEIEDRDSGDYQDDPAIAVFGPHFELPKQWQLTLHVTNIDGFAVQCYGKLPLIRDDYRIENESIHLTFSEDDVRLQAWRHNDTVAHDMHFSTPASDRHTHTIQIRSDESGVSLSVDDVPIGQVETQDIFDSHQLWLGFNSNASTTITNLQLSGDGPVNSRDSSTIYVPHARDGLQGDAHKINNALLLGVAVAPGPLVEDRLYEAIALGGNYGVFTLENSMKPVHLMPRRNTPSFEEADATIALAQRHGIATHGHTLVFGESLPSWMRELPVETDHDRHVIMQTMTDYITIIMSHYKGKIKSWDVINEPLAALEDETPRWRRHLWYQAMGKGYVETALRAARQADPEALLFINENALENDTDTGSKNRWRMLMDDIVLPMKAKGLIDGVGIQGHVAQLPRDAIDEASLTNHFRELESHGLLGRLSEIDVDTNSDTKRAEQYTRALRACLMAKNCISFTMWGVMSGYENEGLIWGADGRPQIAVQKMRELLRR